MSAAWTRPAAGARAACARSTRSRRGAAWATTTSARYGGGSRSGAWSGTRRAAARRRRDEAHRLLVRRHLAVRLPRVRAPAAGARGLQLRSAVPPGAVRRAARSLGAEGAGRDRAQARMDVSPHRLAVAHAERPDPDAGDAPFQSIAAAAARTGLLRRRRHTEPPRRRNADAPRLAWRRRGHRRRAAARVERDAGAAPRPGRRRRQ